MKFIVTIKQLVNKSQSFYKNVRQGMKASLKERNRVLIILFSLLFIIDYFMICLHIEKNIFDIFPSIPILEQHTKATVYLPSLDGKTLLKEERKVPHFNKNEKLAKHLFKLILDGSIYENTSIMVPVKLSINKIWLHGTSNQVCVFDIAPTTIDKALRIKKGTESLFKKALSHTIKANIPTVKEVICLEKGIPHKRLWEL